MSTPVTLNGRLGGTPELKFGNSGAIASFSIVTDRRTFNKNTNTWESVDATWWRCTAFGQLAENLAESVDKGDAVIVVGRAVEDSWNDKNTGQKRTAMKVIADEVAPSLRWATAKIAKASGTSGSSGDTGPRQQSQGSGTRQPQAAQQTGGWGSSDPAPF
jgi:single-strand DNA-binding protein